MNPGSPIYIGREWDSDNSNIRTTTDYQEVPCKLRYSEDYCKEIQLVEAKILFCVFGFMIILLAVVFLVHSISDRRKNEKVT